MAASSGSSGAFLRAARPYRAERTREILRGRVALAGEGEHAAALPDRHLRQNMGGGAEAVEPERRILSRFAFARHAIAAPADQPGAEPGCDLGVVAGLAQRKAKARIGNRMGRVAAVARIAGEHRRIAQVLGAAAAIGTDATGRAQPGHADALSDRKSAHACPNSCHAADDLVARHDRQLGMRELAVNHMQIRAADPASRDLDHDFARAGRWNRPLAHDERLRAARSAPWHACSPLFFLPIPP